MPVKHATIPGPSTVGEVGYNEWAEEHEVQGWTDLRFPAQGINPAGSAAPPTVITDLTGLTGCLSFSGSLENIIAGVAQMPHEWDRGLVHPHIHWTKPTGSSSAVTWEFYYRIVGNPGDVIGSWQGPYSPEATIGDPTVSNAHLLSSFPDIDLTGYIESAILLWRVHRRGDTDAESNAVTLYEFDIHYNSNKPGTTDEIPTE